ncbi:hypothetical protein D3C79_951640 [compost metagenome]
MAAKRQPLRQSTRLGQSLPPTAEGGQQLGQLPGQLRDQPARFVIRQHALPIAGIAVHGVSQQHAGNAELPGMLAGGRQIQFTYVIVIQPPTDAGFPHPVT